MRPLQRESGCAYAATYRPLQRRRIVGVGIVAGKEYTVDFRRNLPGCNYRGNGGSLLRDDTAPFRIRKIIDDLPELAMAALGHLFERQLLVVALRADHACEASALAEQRAAVEHPLHEAVGQAEH